MNGLEITVRNHSIKKTVLSKYDELDVCKMLLDTGMPIRWIMRVYKAKIDGKRIMAMSPEFRWFVELNMGDWKYLCAVFKYVCIYIYF